ncbi:PREDICTED: uncharacterized protein LOC108560243 [Nicrophorus vespilloides]|uniref:Uncharacterized protein LOC108560243 n=1 Tax=Nicrophorus vespilloides TaxID=110193 RepID=A0ABM1MF42_NICVS|nr:PREDICTED: uncharacterized protein LOC108560243 [Nicrophorus vespilloides]
MLIKSLIFALLVSAVVGDGAARNGSNVKLSRRKRYLVFPEGSSLQLVFCLTTPIIGYATIFTIGWTAALAWELPSDPHMLIRKPGKIVNVISNRKDVVKPIFKEKLSPTPIKYKESYNSPNYKISSRPAYYFNSYPELSKYQTIPTYSKYNTLNMSPYKSSINRKTIYRKPVYPKTDYSDPTNYYSNPSYHHIHRRTRRDLYSKIEKFFQAQSKDGRACLLKSVCEVNQAPPDKGTFLEEIVKVIFRAKPHEDHEDEDEYDKASNRIHNCTELYPTCHSSVWNII